MKTTTSNPARPVCRMVRGWISVFGHAADGEVRGLGASHVAACADCQAYFGACDELERALKRDALRATQPAPDWLEQNIIRAVHQSAAPSRATHRAWLPLAAAAACAVVAALVFQQRGAPEPATGTMDQFVSNVKPSADAMLAGEPLQNEVNAVVSNAQVAVQFLAKNFLPTPPDEPSRGE